MRPGEFALFIVGDSGSGKSTLIKLLLKELEPTEGTITIDGRKLNKIKRRQIPKFRRNIGVVFQDFRLLKDRKVPRQRRVCAEGHRAVDALHQQMNVPTMLSMVGLAAKYRLGIKASPAVSSESGDRKGACEQAEDPAGGRAAYR